MTTLKTKKIQPDVVTSEIPSFTNSKGEKMDITEIISSKKIVSVTIKYSTLPIKTKMPGWRGFLGFKKINQEEKEIKVMDYFGIEFSYYPGIDFASIRFGDRREFKKMDENYDRCTFSKKTISTGLRPCQFSFHMCNVKSIEWIEK